MIDHVRYDPADAYSHSTRFIVRGGVERRLNPAREAAVVPSVVGMMLAVVAGFVRS